MMNYTLAAQSTCSAAILLLPSQKMLLPLSLPYQISTKLANITKSAKAIQQNWKSTIISGISKLLDTHYFNTQIQKNGYKNQLLL